MIQRIQSLYLLIATALMGVALLMPVATFTATTGEVFTLSAFSLSSAGLSQSTIWMGILMVAATVLPFITLFLFKRRMLQVRLCAVEIVLLLGCIAFEAIYYYLSGANALAEVAHRQFGWAAIMPIIALILSAMAARATFKDEVMVRSFDRIR
jgi:hypothetical protein